MRDEPAALTGEKEVVGCLLLPRSQGGRGRQMIKRVVDFDCAQVAGIEWEELVARHS